MIPFWVVAVLIWNVGYCLWKTLQDFNSPKPMRGWLGLPAILGAIMFLALAGM
jgi:hypothetical protein